MKWGDHLTRFTLTRDNGQVILPVHWLTLTLGWLNFPLTSGMAEASLDRYFPGLYRSGWAWCRLYPRYANTYL